MDRFGVYNTRRWRRLRAAKLRQDPFCEYCKAALAKDVDHRVPIAKGGDAWAWDNLAASCHQCHSRKTRNVDVLGRNSVPVRGVDPITGLPLDPRHWWQRRSD